MNANSTAKFRLDTIKSKNDLIGKYVDDYGIGIQPNELRTLQKHVDIVSLEIVLKKKVALQKQSRAATVIQKQFRGFLCRKWY